MVLFRSKSGADGKKCSQVGLNRRKKERGMNYDHTFISDIQIG